MPEYTFVGPTGWRYEDEQFTTGETVDVPEGFAASFPQFFEGVDADDAEVDPENPAVEPTTEDRELIPTDPAEFTVDEFEAHIEESDYSEEELDQFARVEASGKDRTGVHEAIDEER